MLAEVLKPAFRSRWSGADSADPADPVDPSPEQDGIGDARIGWIAILLFFGLFLGSAAFIRLDAAAYAEGVVSVAGSRQAVQHRDGGTVKALHVREGQHVRASQVLIELAGGEVVANERSLAAQVITLQARRSRLLAEHEGAGSIVTPREFAALAPEDRQIADEAMRLARSELAARRSSVASQKRVLGQRSAQLDEQIGGLGRQIDSNRRQESLFNDQLTGMRTLAEQGYVSRNRIRELERAEASVSGDTARLAASSASAREQIGEVRMQSLTLDSQTLAQVSEDLRTTEDSLNEALPRWIAAQRQVENTRIRATASGQVVGLAVFTVGGVIGPGQKLMEIVPDAAPLVVEAMVSPNDADDLHVGQTAEIRFTSLHERDLPAFEGRITRISADSLTEERSGARYFSAEITVPPEDIAEVHALKTGGDGIKPGLPVQVLVPLRRRTMLDYLVEPINQALWRSGREH